MSRIRITGRIVLIVNKKAQIKRSYDIPVFANQSGYHGLSGRAEIINGLIARRSHFRGALQAGVGSHAHKMNVI